MCATAVDQTFATTPNTPASGLSLFRFSVGHGGLQCEACHGSTHAEFPTSEPNDNIRNTELQGHAGPMAECSACHATVPSTLNGGPHGMHPVGSTWVSAHQGHSGSACQACHGTDYRGTVLSEMQADRTVNGRSLFRGAIVSCYICHNGPGGSGTPPAAPTASNVSASTTRGKSVAITLPISGSGAYRAHHLSASQWHYRLEHQWLYLCRATYFPATGFSGTDKFTFAAYDGYNNSALATGTVTVGGGSGTVAPTISSQPVSQAVSAGANVTFTVGATGTAPLSYQWQKNGTTISGATGSSLTLASVTTASAGNYQAMVSNSAGSTTSATAALIVTTTVVAPSIATPPASQTVTAGANVSFSVVAQRTAPLSYQWRKNGTSITGATSATLTLNNVATNDAGSYTVRVSNTGGSVTSATATLTVHSSTTNPPPDGANGAADLRQHFQRAAQIRLTAQATDSNGRISRVTFYNGRTAWEPARWWTTQPTIIRWFGICPPASTDIRATATDNLGATSTSASVRITVGSSSTSYRLESD